LIPAITLEAVPLPLSFSEVARAADLLVEVVRTRAYDDPAFRQRSKVT
jgi:hypothetical protein